MIKLYFLFAVYFFQNFFLGGDVNHHSPREIVNTPTAIGIVYFQSAFNLEDSYTNFKSALGKNEKIKIFSELDYTRNEASVNGNVPNSRLILFGNPGLGTPLMQQNQLAGLDLPQKVLFYEEGDEVFALYNSTHYLASRYGLGEMESLAQIADALKKLVGTAVEAGAKETTTQRVGLHQGIVNVESTGDFESTYNNLKSAIKSRGNIRLITEIDHGQNAEKAGMELRPTRLIIFGNPHRGIPFMQSAKSIGLDLPQKMLVWEDEKGKVHISYNHPQFLKTRHQLKVNEEQIKKITHALERLSHSAAGIE